MVSSPAPTELFRFSRRHHQEHPYLWLWLASGSVLAHLALILMLRPWMVQTDIAPVAGSQSDVTSVQLIEAAPLPPNAAAPSPQAAPAEAEVEKIAIAKPAPAPTTPQTVILPGQPAKAPASDAIAKPNPTQTQQRPVTAPAPPPLLSPFPKAPEPDANLNPNSPLPSQGQPTPAAPAPPPAPAPAPAAAPASPAAPGTAPLENDLVSDDLINEETGLNVPKPAPDPLPSLSPSVPIPSAPIQPAPVPAPSRPERLPDVPTTYDTSQGFNTEPVPLNPIPVQPEVAPSEVTASVSATPTPITNTSRDILDTYATPRQTQETFLLSDAQASCSLGNSAAWQMIGQTVSAQVVVDTSGQAEVIPGTERGTGNADYDQFAFCLVEQHWQFEPATMDGQPVWSDNLTVEVTLSRS